MMKMTKKDIEMAAEWACQCALILELVQLMSWEEEMGHLVVGSSASGTAEPWVDSESKKAHSMAVWWADELDYLFCA